MFQPPLDEVTLAVFGGYDDGCGIHYEDEPARPPAPPATGDGLSKAWAEIVSGCARD